jgi:hypothetical protein
MANPNLVNVGTIRGQTAYIAPAAVTAATAWTYDGTTSLTGLTPAANTINKINTMMVSNVTASATTITVEIANNATFASGTAYAIAWQIAVPPGATLVVIDKTAPIYVSENQSIGVIVGTASALEIVASFDVLT